MKKFLTMTLACAMTLSLAACGSKTDTAANGNDSQQAAGQPEETKTYKVAIINSWITPLWTKLPTPLPQSWTRSPLITA